MLVLERVGLKLKYVDGSLPARGSAEIPVTVQDDGSYSGYTPKMLIGFGFNFNRKFEMKSPDAGTTNVYTLPAEFFAEGGDTCIAMMLIDGKQQLCTNQCEFHILETPYRIVQLPITDV